MSPAEKSASPASGGNPVRPKNHNPFKIMNRIINDTGDMKLAGCNEANIPVNCVIHSPDDHSKKWRWTASCFQPRRNHIVEDAYEFEADSEQDILDAVNQFVVPLYENAVMNLKAYGKNYYWE